MAKIRISEKDKKEYAKLKKNVQSKIKRAMKKYGVDLEKEISVPNLSDFKTRKEFNKFKEKANSFTNRNNTRYQFRKNKKGMTYSVAELNEAKRANRIERSIAKSKQKEYKNKPFMRHGQQSGTVADRFGMLKRPKNIGFSIPAKFDIDNYYTRYDFQKRKEAMEKRATPGEFDRRLENFKDSFILGLYRMYNGDEESYAVIKKIMDVPADQLYDLYLEHDEMQTVYNPSPRESYEGFQVVDDDEWKKNLFEVEKIIDRESEEEGLLRNFPIN